MSEQAHQQVVEGFWSAFDRFDFEGAGEFLHDDFVFHMPQSGERIRGRENFIAMNSAYPGRWRIRIVKMVISGDDIVTEIEASYEGQQLPAVSFFTLSDGKILSIREFWPEAFPAPEWRSQWVE